MDPGQLLFLLCLIPAISLVILLIAFLIKDTFFPNHLKAGTIIEKRHEPERRWIGTESVLVGKVMIPFQKIFIDDEDWVFIIEGIDKKGKTKQQKLYVSPETWVSFNVGQWYETQNESEFYDHHKTREPSREELANPALREEPEE